MKILLIADVSIAKVLGGAERVLFEQSTRLTRRGYDVHILTRRLERHATDHEVIQGVTEWRYEADIQKSAGAFLMATYRKGRNLFEKLHKDHNFDLIIIYQPFSGLGVIRSPLGKKIRKIYTCFSFSFEEFISRNTCKDGLLQKYKYLINIHTRKWIENRALRSCDKIVVLSQYTRERLWDVYHIPPQNISIVPGGIDLSRFQPAKDKQIIRRRLNMPDGKVIVFSVRNLVPRMGLENLLKAFKKVVHKAPDIYLVLGGEGPLKEDLTVLSENFGLEDFISFEGFIPEKQLPEYYRMADLFILPTRELEGFGLVTLEAMASGIPVLGTPVGGTKEILGKFDSSFLFENIDSDSMAASILDNYRQIKDNPEKWQKISCNCRKFVEANYSWEKNIDSLEKILLTSN
ncbi:MAG: glycosyltransferase family 4 protein [Desulfobacterales bacterium]|nr:MAG: glycosyltransferase family 4 protein [Desulfobacterales bacterium]